MEVGDSGPVMTLLNKKLRALRKKQNKIAQIEDNLGKGRSINKEQEEVLRSKLPVAILVEEYEKLCLLLPTAVKEELEKVREGGKPGPGAEEREGEGEDVKEAILMSEAATQVSETQVSETQVSETQVSETHVAEPLVESLGPPLGQPLGQPLGEALVQAPVGTEEEEKDVVVHSANGEEELDSNVADLMTLLYFGCLFDVRPRGGELLPSLIWPKVHERSSCLSYDFVTEDSASPLKEEDLDALASLATLCTSRPPNATLSHRDALRQCARHALLWRRGSDLPIHAELLPLSYSHLKERLNRILSSEYFTMIPELQTVSQEEAEAAAGQYVTRVLAHEASARNNTLEGGAPAFYSQQDESRDIEEYYEGGEDYDNSSGNGKAEMPESAKEAAIYEESPTETKQQVSSKFETNQTIESKGVIMEPEPHVAPTSQASAHEQPSSRVSHMSVGPRGYPSSRDGANRGGGVYGASGSRGGRGYMYTNGRGSRARAGPPPSYSNGRGGGGGPANYDQQGGYYQPRNYYGRGGRSGPRGGGNMAYNEQHEPNGPNTTSTTLQSS